MPDSQDSPYNYIGLDQRRILEELFKAEPKALRSWKAGRPVRALRQLRDADVSMPPGVDMTKTTFLGMVNLAMPNKYSI